MKNRFDQLTFKLFTQAKQLSLKVVGKQDVTDVFKVRETNVRGDYDADSLTLELQILPTIFECKPINLGKVAKVLKLLSREKRMLVGICITVIRIILTVSTTSAAPERPFLMMRRIKTWLLSRMAQKSPLPSILNNNNSLSILYDNKSILDDISLLHRANDFVDHHPD